MYAGSRTDRQNTSLLFFKLVHAITSTSRMIRKKTMRVNKTNR